jgi:predicted amidohydrolase YtcJ
MLLLYNARIYTPHSPAPHTAVVIDGGRILALGSNETLLSEFGHKASRRDMQGCTLWPGLIDAHIHLQHYALALQKVDCETPSRAACLQRVAVRCAETPPGQWVTGHGWNHNAWPEGLGDTSLLDAAAPNHPVYLTAKSLHAAWANTAAMKLAGIGAHTPDPPGRIIQRGSHPPGAGQAVKPGPDRRARF